MMSAMKIRLATVAEYGELGRLMFEAVHVEPSPYTEAQRRAWAPVPRQGVDWAKRLAAQTIFVGERDGALLGFMSLAPKGYVDFAYIRAQARGSGLFSQLFDEIERTAQERGEARLWVHASLAAEPAFSRKGFGITREEVVEIAGEQLRRFEMEKSLA
jgi:putative acetyltransferase